MGKALEYIGFGLIIFATLILICRTFIEGQAWFDWLTKNQELFYWLGLGAWAFGYMMRQQKNKS